MLPEPYNEYPCPNCEEDVRVGLPAAKYVDCPSCKAKLEIHPDAEFEDGMWHDRTTLSIVDYEGTLAESIKRVEGSK